MRRAYLTPILGALASVTALVTPARAQVAIPVAPQATEAAPLFGPPTASTGPVDGPSEGRAWAEADFLFWWMKGTALPALVTTSPAGTPINQAGVLGSSSTTVLFGNSTANVGARAGGRIEAGYWFDDHCCGIQADFFMLESKASDFSAASNGSPILSRPFTDAISGAQASQRIAFPGDTTGSVHASAGTTGLLGTSILLRENVHCTDCFRLDVLGGYRYLHFADRMTVNEDLTNVNPTNPNFIPLGANIAVTDRFATSNDLHALDLGLVGTWRRGALALDVRGRLAVGYDRQIVDIDGSTIVTVTGAPTAVNRGGLLALSSNIGHHVLQDVSVVPQLDVKLAYQITPSLTASIGYTFLYWNNVVRAADQIDTTVNATLIPPVIAASGPARPALPFAQNNLWAQGINFGLELRY
jgi:hypothetical protein